MASLLSRKGLLHNKEGGKIKTASSLNQQDGTLKRLTLIEAENKKLMDNQATLIQETNSRIQKQLQEVRSLKEERDRLRKETSELRDLCCFLDDDRQRTKRLSREWQRFGRYTANVMKQEVVAYQEKLQELERLQGDLVSENGELKQLCLYLDERRSQPLLSCPSCGLRQQNDDQQPRMPYSPPSSSEAGSTDSDDMKPEADKKHPKDDKPLFNMKDGSKFRNLLTNPTSTPWYELEHTLSPEHLTNQEGSAHPVTSNENVFDNKGDVLEYIKSLEERVVQLERGPQTDPIHPNPRTSIDNSTEPSALMAASQQSCSSNDAFTSYASSTCSEDSAILTAMYFPNQQPTMMTDSANSLRTIPEEIQPITRTPSRISRRGHRTLDPLNKVHRSVSEPAHLNVVTNEMVKDEQVVSDGTLTRHNSMFIPSNVHKQIYDWKHALKVLELQELATSDDMGEAEKAILEQMCKVAWKCLDTADTSSCETLTTTTAM